MKALEERRPARSVRVNAFYISVAGSGDRISTVIAGEGGIERGETFAYLTGQVCVHRDKDRGPDAEVSAGFKELIGLHVKLRSHLSVNLH